jgi:chemotaxis protein methyltransferase CheR
VTAGGPPGADQPAPARARPGQPDGLEMSEAVFKLFQGAIHRSAGIYLAEHKRALLVRRLRGRLRTLGLDSYLDYYRLVTRRDDSSELVTMLDLVTTNETRFFRESLQLDLLERELLPALQRAAGERRRPRRVRAWCAACSSGEEPFTLAALLACHLPAEWRREVLATDLSTRMLERARRASWPVRQLAQIPARYRSEFAVRPACGDGQETIEASARLRAMIRFERHNLHLDAPAPGPFDLVLCRNVLMYFDLVAKRQVVARLLSVLADDGYLLVGHADSLSGLDPRLRLVAPTVYARSERPAGASEPAPAEPLAAPPGWEP